MSVFSTSGSANEARIEGKGRDIPIAYVLLDSFVAPNIALVAEALRARHPELPIDLQNNSGSPNATADGPIFRCAEETVVIIPVPAPIPPDQGLWSRTATAWPEGKAIAAQHRAHLIVSILGKGEQLPVARILTAVVGALISVVPECCCVVWRDQVARPPKRWLEMSSRSFAAFPDYPFTLWLDILPFRSSATIIGAVTRGLAAFVGREIEFETGKLDLRFVIDKVAGLSAYLVEHGPVIKDGDTFGDDEGEQFRISYANSTRFPGLPVFFCGTPLAS